MKNVIMALAMAVAMSAFVSCACCNNSEKTAQEPETKCCATCCDTTKTCCDSTACAACDSSATCTKK